MDPKPILQPKKILLIRLKAVGDVVLITPVLRALRREFPHAQIDMLTDARCAPILSFNPNLDHLIISPHRAVSLMEQWKFLQGIRAEKYDLVLDLFGNPRSAWATLFSGAKVRSGYSYRVRRWAYTHPVPMNQVRKYQVSVNLDVLEYLGIPSDGIRTEMFVSAEEKQWAIEALKEQKWDPGPGRPRIALNPSGTWSAKKWPLVHWRELVEELRRKMDSIPLVLWGPDDGADVNRLIEGMKGQVILAPRTDLRQLAALISSVDIVIGNDGAPQHIAQALGVKTLTIYGPTWGLSWCRPTDPSHRFLQHMIACGPCDKTLCPNPALPGSGGHSHKECMMKIPPSRVATVAMEMLSAV